MVATFNAAFTFVRLDTPVTLPLELDSAFDDVVQGGTGPRIPDRGLVGRSGHQAAKKKNGPPHKLCSNRLLLLFTVYMNLYIHNRSSTYKYGE